MTVTSWYLWTAILAAIIVIVPGIGRGANGLVRVGRFLVHLFKMPGVVASLYAEFRQHAADDLAFQSWITRKLDLDKGDGKGGHA